MAYSSFTQTTKTWTQFKNTCLMMLDFSLQWALCVWLESLPWGKWAQQSCNYSAFFQCLNLTVCCQDHDQGRATIFSWGTTWETQTVVEVQILSRSFTIIRLESDYRKPMLHFIFSIYNIIASHNISAKAFDSALLVHTTFLRLRMELQNASQKRQWKKDLKFKNKYI